MYNYENYNKVKEMIDERRENARRESEMRSARLRMLSPELDTIDEILRG